MLKPIRLQEGDTIGVVAPAGVVDPGALDAGVSRLQAMGFSVVLGEFVRKRNRYHAGSDKERAWDLYRVATNPKIRAVIFARGGYGSAKLIPHLVEVDIHGFQKIFVGSSDATALLHYLMKRLRMVTFHGPMVAPNFGSSPSELTETYFRKILMEPRPAGVARFETISVLRPGSAEGILQGGCLSLICAGLGTYQEVDTEGTVLFLEDIHEAPYRIDRMLTQLKQAGKFDGVRAVVFGKMPDCFPDAGAGYRLEEVILDVLSPWDFPIWMGFPSGHGGDNVVLPLGTRVAVHEDGSIAFLESGVIEARGAEKVLGGTNPLNILT